MLTIGQFRASLAASEIKMKELASKTGTSVATVDRFSRGLKISDDKIKALTVFMHKQGFTFSKTYISHPDIFKWTKLKDTPPDTPMFFSNSMSFIHLKTALYVANLKQKAAAPLFGVSEMTLKRLGLGMYISEYQYLKIQAGVKDLGFGFSSEGLLHPTYFKRKTLKPLKTYESSVAAAKKAMDKKYAIARDQKKRVK